MNYASNFAYATSETINFQGKIVRNDTGNEGLNVVAGSPACVVSGNSNDTCDFRVKFYNANTAGTLLGTEVFSNIEIGYYDGVFNLVLGSGSYSAGSETSFRNIFLNNSQVFIEVDFAPDGSTYTETFLDSGGLRMGVRAAAYAISSSGANKQFQFDTANNETGYSGVAEGQVFFDADDNVLRVYDGSNWLAVQAYLGNYSSLWNVNETPTPDVISSYTGLDVAFGGNTSSAPFFYDVSAELLTLTNSTGGVSFRVNDNNSDITPFVIDTAGNVGIGTDTPGYKLEVVGGRTVLKANSEEYTLGISRTDGSAGNYWLGVDNTATPSLYFKNNTGDNRLIVADSGQLTQISSNSTENGIILKRPTTDSTHVQWQLFGQTNNKDFWITAFDGSSTKNFAKFYWDNSVTNFDAGNVGIGVASPNAFLDIKAATTSSAQINLTTSAGVNPSSPVSGDLWWNGTNLYFFDGSTNVDILVGTGGPGGDLFTDGGAVTYLTSTTDDFALGGTDSTAPFFYDEGAELLTLTNTTAGLSFRVNDEASDTTPFVIDANGNVGIGTSTPGAKLDIAGASSTISNTAGDITIDAYSGNISFAGDSMTNVLNATFSGDVTLNGGQIRLGNHSSNPTSIGEGAMVYNSTDKKLYYYKDTGWSEVGGVYTGTANQTLRHNGTDWIATSAFQNDGTNVTATGQVRVGNYGTKPSGIGAGALVYDTTLGSLFVYDGADWKAISTSQMLSTNGTVSDGSYLQLTHNLNTFDLISSAWVKVGTQWKQALDASNSVIQDFDNQYASLFKDKSKLSNVKINYSDNGLGTGLDGAITVNSNRSINTATSISGRSCADGGDAVNYSVTGLTANTATLETTPSAGCLATNDEVLIINLRGNTTSFGNVGNWETLRIQSIASNVITFTTNKNKYYGDGTDSNDTNIGVGTSAQAVMLQRVPNYTNVTVDASVVYYPDDWVQPTGAVNNGAGEGGVMFFRATGSVTINGTIHAVGKGYVAGTGSGSYGTSTTGGEAFCATNGVAAGNGGHYASRNGGSGICGGGGGAGNYVGVGAGTGGTGSATQGGAGGGGGSGYYYYGGGGGGGGYGGAGNGGGGANAGAGGSTSASGNGGSSSNAQDYIGGGGGGGTYGDSSLNDLMFGSSGGGGGGYDGTHIGGNGGRGGGIVYIAGNNITVNGFLLANGNAGTAGTGTYGSGGGGGAGGSLKVTGNVVDLGGSTKTTALGGAGGGNGRGGGAGGVGRIAAGASTTLSNASNPAYAPLTVGYNNYAIFVSNEVHTPRATSYGNISWTENLPANTEIQFQTRSGSSPDSLDGTWEAWKPTTTSVNINDATVHTDFTGTNVTVADGDVTRNVDFFEDEDEFTAGNLIKLTATASNGYAERTIASTDLSTYTYITAWVRSSVAGNAIKLGFGESAATEQERVISIDSINTWQKVYWDISGITGTARDAVTKFRVTLTTNATVAYIDSINAQSYLTTPGGSTITSTANNYIQYRAILTTSNISNTPTLSNITIGYTNTGGTYTIDANRIKANNSVRDFTSGRLILTENQLNASKMINTSTALASINNQGKFDPGTGSDGAITVNSNRSINTATSISGRSCADGGDAVNYSVTGLTSNTATLESSPSAGCLAVNDEVLIINLRGNTTSFGNVGNWETLRVQSVVSNVVTFTTNKVKYYGDGTDSNDNNIGVGTGAQAVMLQRVPNYTNVTVDASVVYYPDDWVQPTGAVNNGAGEGGVMFFRATGSVTINGTIHAVGKGYVAGTGSGSYGNSTTGGEAFCGTNGVAAGNGGHYTSRNGGSGICGGGGGAGLYYTSGGGGTGGTGSATQGGAGGGGGSGYYYYGGGGGGGGYGGAGNGGGGVNAGAGGSTGASGNGGSTADAQDYIGGGGGGGTYGDSSLNDLMFGSSGGGGGGYDGSHVGGAGGRGGGIVYIAGNNITVNGFLLANGNAGTAGTGTYGSGGGGGAGGSLKVTGNVVDLGGSTKTTALGGAGGGNGRGGGAGGVGRIAAGASTTLSNASNPAYAPLTVGYNNYALVVSDEIPTYQATEYGNLIWNFNDNGYGDIQLQTRSGMSNNSSDGTWEAWKPVTASTNYVTLNDMNTVGDWSVTNQSAVADGDATRNVDFFEDEDETTVGNIAKFVSTSANGYAEDTITSTDLSNYDYITAWIYSATTGNILKLGFGESAGTEQEETISIDRANTWQKVYWDISDVDKSLRNAVTKIRMTIIPTGTTIQMDNMEGERLLRNNSGATITSTPNDYIQYRAIFSTTNESYRPMLYSVQLTWKTGYKLVNTDANTTRLYNYSGQTQDLRINVTTSGGTSALGSGWTESGGNIYRSTGNVGIGDSTPDTTLKVVGSLCVKSDANNCAGSTAGTIYANNLSVQSADLAEMYRVNDQSIEKGDVVSFSKGKDSEIEKSIIGNANNVMGVISTAPGLVMNDDQKESHRPVALLGRVPVKVIAGSTSIIEGDALGVSAVPGFAGKMNDSGYVVGRALENTLLWSDQNCPQVKDMESIVWPNDNGKNEQKPCFRVPMDTFDKETRDVLMEEYTLTLDDDLYVGKVNAYVSVQWYQPDWVNEGLAGLLGGQSGMWTLDGDRLTTSGDVAGNSFTGNTGNFSILSGGLLNIADGKLTVDGSGNLGVAGDMLINGEISGVDGNVKFSLGDSDGAKAFEIRNSNGEIVFSVDSKGEVGGSSVYKTTWLKVDANSNITVSHYFGKVPSDISIVMSSNSDGSNFSTKGLGTDYYYESVDNDNLKIINSTDKDIFVKLTIQR